MANNAKELISKEYGLELIGCVLSELSKIEGFERLAIIKHAHDLLIKECKDDTATFLSGKEKSRQHSAHTSPIRIPVYKQRRIPVLNIFGSDDNMFSKDACSVFERTLIIRCSYLG